MEIFFGRLAFLFLLLGLSGCVVTHYKDAKGQDCTRRYFTVMGIATHSCTEGSRKEAVALAVNSVAKQPIVVTPAPASSVAQPAAPAPVPAAAKMEQPAAPVVSNPESTATTHKAEQNAAVSPESVAAPSQTIPEAVKK